MKQQLTVDRISVHSITNNHLKVILMGLEFDFSYGELFALTYQNKTGERIIICNTIKKGEEHKKGYHFNTLEPNHKLRLPRNEWKKTVNKVLRAFILQIPKEKVKKVLTSIGKGGTILKKGSTSS